MVQLTLHSAVQRLQTLNEAIACQLARKPLVTILKLFLIGFYLDRQIDQRIYMLRQEQQQVISSALSALADELQQLQTRINEIKNRGIPLPPHSEQELVTTAQTLQRDLQYLQVQQIHTERIDYPLLLSSLATQYTFITTYNQELAIRRAHEQLQAAKTEILQAHTDFQTHFNHDRYFTQREYVQWHSKWAHIKDLFLDRDQYRVADLDFVDTVKNLQHIFETGDQLRRSRNEAYVKNEVQAYRDLFDSLESYPLTPNQRHTIVTDECANLVIAGAGTGKTSTLVGKAGYLLNKGLASPRELLLIAFARKARDELDHRVVTRFNTRLNVNTFHALGLHIISEVEQVQPMVSPISTDRLQLLNKIEEFISTRLTTDAPFAQHFFDFCSYNSVPYRSMLDFASMSEYIQYIRNFDLRSLQGERVKSYEECIIANFLYRYGIRYEYEAPYEFSTASKRYRQYRPDFYLPEYNLYIEHFGINRNGDTAPYISRLKYRQDMEWKQKLHTTHNTTLIETYSYEQAEGTLLTNLRQHLEDHGVVFTEIDSTQLFDQLYELGLVSPLTRLLGTFLNLFKSLNMTIEELQQKVHQGTRRDLNFLNLFIPILDDYSQFLAERQEIDFNDMINRACTYIQEGKYPSPFRYILVDEFQDISQSRFRLMTALLQQQPSSKLFCVGDDWQSIYRFTGSDLSLMTQFRTHFPFSETLFLEKTFRFDDKLCDFTTRFILNNPEQISKHLTTHTTSSIPAVTLYEQNIALSTVLTEIAQQESGNAEVFIIGRYNHLLPLDMQELTREHPTLTIRYVTAHSSKGTEADYVILIGLTAGKYGFPCQIEDDPILNLVLTQADPYPNAEERRLFYVAMTRAKKHVYLLTNGRPPSQFIVEITQNDYPLNRQTPTKAPEIPCPICKSGVLHRRRRYGNPFSCSYAPYCEYQPPPCPRCHRGYLYRNPVPGRRQYFCSNNRCQFKSNICPLCDDGYLIYDYRVGRHTKCSNSPECTYQVTLSQTRNRRRKRPSYIT